MRVNRAVVSGCLSGDGGSVGPVQSRVMCPQSDPGNFRACLNGQDPCTTLAGGIPFWSLDQSDLEVH